MFNITYTASYFWRRRFNRSRECHRKRAIGDTKKTQFSLFIGARCVKLMGNIAHELLSFVLCRRFGGPSCPISVLWRFRLERSIFCLAWFNALSHTAGERGGIPKWYIRKQTHFYGPIIMPLHCIISCGEASIARSHGCAGCSNKKCLRVMLHTHTKSVRVKDEMENEVVHCRFVGWWIWWEHRMALILCF